jgi:hypothetical protein
MHSAALQVMLSKKTPAAQRNFRKAMRGFVDHCIAKGMIEIDPLAGLKLSKMKVKGHHTWTVDGVAQYRHQHAPDKARFALELLLQTGHARSAWGGSTSRAASSHRAHELRSASVPLTGINAQIR